MKKQIFLVLACLVGAVQAFGSGSDTDCCNDCLDFDSKLSVDFGGGLRWDDLSYKRHNGCAHVRDKLNDIKIGQIQADVQYLACEHYLLKGYFDYGWVYGKAKNSTRFDDDSYSSFSSGGNSSRAKNGHAYDLYGAVGYQFNFDCYQLSFAPLVGYSYNFLKLDRKNNDSGSFYDSGSVYGSSSGSSSGGNGKGTKFSLSGPWVGFAAIYQWSCDLQVFVDYAFHWAEFNVKADDTCLLQDFGSYRSKKLKSKNTYGNEVWVGANYKLCDNWFAGLNFNYRNWYGSKKNHSNSSGSDIYSGSSEDFKLRNFDWNTYIVSLDIGYAF